MNADVYGLSAIKSGKPALDTSRKLASPEKGVEAYVAYWPWQEVDMSHNETQRR
jgi:hypothetical protein